MKLSESKHLIALLGVLALVFSGCASGGSKPEAQQTAQQIEAPKTVSGPDKSLYSQALKAQNAGQFESAIKLWQDFLSKNPNSFEGHNNLGLVYYTQDMLAQALQEFETAYRLEPVDPRIRKNLARALRFKASMIQERRDYFKTLEILARLEEIVEPEEKQAILFKQEQVEDQIFLQVIKANNSASYQDFINRFPDGLNAVRAREYLKEHPHKVSKSTSQSKSWLSSGKVVINPSDGTPWASSKQPPDYASARPSATYTPPPAGTKKKKAGDFFGTDSAAVEDVTEENIAAAQEMDPAAAIPFEDFEKPERSSGEQAAAEEPDAGKENLRVAGEFNPIRDEPDEGAAGLDTLPDLTPSQVAAVPAEMDAPQSTDTAAGDIKMQPAEQEPAKTVTASAEDQEEPEMAVAQAESAEPEPAQPEPVQEMEAEPQATPEEFMEEASISQEAESATPESVESESERIARIVREEIAIAESAESEQAQPEPVQEPEPVEEQPDPIQAGRGKYDAEVAAYQLRIKENPKDIEALIGLATVLGWQKKYQQSSVVYQKVREMRPDIPDGELGLLRLQAWQGEYATAEEGLKALLAKHPERSDIQLLLGQVTAWRMKAEPQASPAEEPVEVARVDPGDQGAQQETIPAESTPVEETPAPDPEEKQKINQETVSETVAALVPSLPQAEATETPAESVDPPTTMVVIEMRQGATLNVRAKPSTQGEILGYLENGDMMPFMSESGDWYQIEIEEGLSGWVSKSYSTTRSVAAEASLPVAEDDMTSELSSLEPEQQQSSGAMAGAMVLVTVREGSTLNVRSLPSPSGAVVDMLFGGDKLPFVKEENGWYQVQFEDETTGWISKKFSVLEGGAPAAPQKVSLPVPVPKKKKKAPWGKKDPKEMVTTVVVIRVPEGSSLNVRSAPSSQGQVLGSLKRGDMRPLLEETGEWYQVELKDGQSGWVSQKFSGKMNLDSSFIQNP